jgi:putative ABC transport system substrate-binding protein
MRFIPLIIAVVLLATPPVLEGQTGRVPRIGLLSPGSPSAATDAFRRGLAEQGYVEGRNIHLDFRWAEGRADRLPVLAAELVQAKVDVIVAFISSAAKAAQQATTSVGKNRCIPL